MENKRNKRKFEKICQWTGLLSGLIQVFDFLRGKELSWRWFCVIIILLLIISIVAINNMILEFLKEGCTCVCHIRDLGNRAEKCGVLRKEYGYRRHKLVKKFYSRCFAILKRKKLFYLTPVIIIVCVCVCNPQNAEAYWEQVQEILGAVTEEESEDTLDVILEPEINEVALEKKDIPEIRDLRWRFVLDEAERIFLIDELRENKVFFYSDKEASEWVTETKGIVEGWQQEPKAGVGLSEVKDDDKNDFYTYTDKEDSFKSDVEKASQYTDLEEWMEYAPLSSELNEYVEGREELNRVEIDGESGNYKIWWMLANDYQYCADEYEMQTTNAEAILYYYVNSIYCCMEALQYSISEEKYNEIFHYMVMRYHDMIRKECIISEEYKERAKDIYTILIEMDVLSEEK